MRTASLCAVLLLLCAGTAAAATLDSVPGEVVQADGTRQELAKRAMVCLGQNVRQEGDGPQTIQVSDPDGGVVVANALFTYSTMGIPGRCAARSRSRPKTAAFARPTPTYRATRR